METQVQRSRKGFRRAVLMTIATGILIAGVTWLFRSPWGRELYLAQRLAYARSSEERAKHFDALTRMDLPRERMAYYAEAVVPDRMDASSPQSWDATFRDFILAGWGRAIVPAMVKELHSKDFDRFAFSAYLLARIGPDATDAVKPLTELLSNRERFPSGGPAHFRLRALGDIAKTLAEINTPSPSASDELVAISNEVMDELEAQSLPRNKAESTRSFYLTWVLGEILKALAVLDTPAKQTVPLCRRILTSDHPELSDHSAHPAYTLLVLAGRTGVDLLIDLTHSDSPLQRVHGVRGLKAAISFDDRAVPALVKALSDPDRKVREFASQMFYYASDQIHGDKELSARLVESFRRESDLEIRCNLLEGIAYTQHLPPDFLPDIVNCLSVPVRPIVEGDWALRSKEGLTVAEQDRLRNLRLQNQRDNAAWAIRHADTLSLEAKNLIFSVIEDPNTADFSMDTAVFTLGILGEKQLESPRAVDSLIRLLNHEEEDVRIEAAWALKGFPSAQARIVPALLEFLQTRPADRDANCAAHSLWQLTGDIEGLISTLRRSLTHPTGAEPYQKRNCRWHALWLLSELGPRAASSAEHVKGIGANTPYPVYVPFALLEGSGDQRLGMRAAFTYWRLTGEPDWIFRLCKGNLKCRDSDMRESAAEWLGYMGGAAESMIPDLQQAARDHNLYARKAALDALVRIRNRAGPQ